MGQPFSPTDLDELRRLMHLDWGELALGNTDRAATLYGRTRDPYHDLALGGADVERFLLIGIYNTLEQADWRLYYKFVNRLCALQLQRERAQARARQEPSIGARPAPPPPPARNVPPAATTPPGPNPSRAAMDTMSVKDMLAHCATSMGVSQAQLRANPDGQPPFT